MNYLMCPFVLWSLQIEYCEGAFIAQREKVNKPQTFIAPSCVTCAEEVRKCNLLKYSLNRWQVLVELPIGHACLGAVETSRM